MADNASILREFLVAIGFRVDEKGLKKVEEGLDKARSGAEKFGLGLIAATTAATVFVDKVASKMEELYWSSVRLRDGAAAIQDFQLRLSKVGGTAEGARAALEGVAAALRTNPAAEGILRNLGITTRDATGNLRSAVDLVQELAQAPMPYWLKAHWAGYFGIDEETLLALQQTAIKTSKTVEGLYRKSGIDADAAAKKSAEYKNRLRDIGASYAVLGTILEVRLLPVTEKIADWFQGLAGWASDALGPTGQLTNILTRMAPVVDDLGHVASGILLIGVNLASLLSHLPNEALEWGAIGYFLFGKKAAVILAALGTISGILDRVIGDRGQVNDRWVEQAGTKGGIAGYGIARWFNDNGLGFLNTNTFNANYDEYKRRQMRGGQGGLLGRGEAYTPSAWSTSGGNGNATRAMAFFEKAGWSASQAAGIVANLIHESGLRAGAVGDSGQAYGVAQWHADRQAAFAEWAGHDIRQSTLEEQLAFVNQELLRGAEQFAARMLSGAQNAAQAAFVVSRYYERPDLAGENLQSRIAIANDLMNGTRLAPGGRGPGGVTINQKTDIRVDGSGDPETTGRAVSREQGRVNGDLARNFAGAVT